MGTKVPVFHPEHWPQMPEGAARAALIGVGFMESWLWATRQTMDLWRTTLREQQDSIIASYRNNIAHAASDEVIEETIGRRPARPSGRASESESADTRH